ncbi:MAG TPA: hypothetical protein DCP92_04780 [Nitrospiraceae bacterium]|jgi:hypothetical protein|nr:hypothetical protein [Nitrospiraceae bacterium]
MKIGVFDLVLFGLIFSSVYAEIDAKEISVYGDHCQLCGEYAYCRKQPTYGQAVSALRSYYEQRGLQVLVLKQKARFLEAEIYKGGCIVDRVLLDLKTGRIRSTY